MTSWLGAEPSGATPLEPEELEQLLPSWIATRADLNAAEAENILQARLIWRRKRMSLEQLLTEKTVRDLHRDMFGDVWVWAGKYRQSGKTIGIDWWQITEGVANLVADALRWVAATASMPLDEAGCRFHHRLVEIHPFPNGNGRHSREMTDLLMRRAGGEPFTWGRADRGSETSGARRTYINALQCADRGDLGPLQAFVRT